MVQIGKKASVHTLIALLIAPLVGCGSSGSTIASNSTAGPSGRSIQGAIGGATVWGDDLSSGTKFAVDPAEQSAQTTTSGTGTYTLKNTPSFKYMIVSQGGTDTLTGKVATTMIAPGGAKAVSPLTSMVMLDTTGKLATTLNAMLPNGASFDTDFTANAGLNASSLMLITSVAAAVTTLNETVRDAATRSGATISPLQLNAVGITVYSQLAAQFSTLSASQLSNTATLATTMQAALGNAISTIVSTNPNLTIPNSVAASIANNSVAVAAKVVGNATGNAQLQAVTAANVQTAPGVTAPTTIVTESQVITGANAQLVISSITNTASSASAGVVVTSTPANYTPPPITVANNPTITGYNLLVVASGSSYLPKTFKITFSDDMVSSGQGDASYAHSVLNPSNYTFSQSGCSPSSYAAKVVTIDCGTLAAGTFTVTVAKGSATAGVWASSTSLGLLVDNSKSFTLPIITGGTGGTTFNLF